mmetsp:Transcript_28989/g.83764  ORF Transcript_28989/g.83764 Transcript_28989/m.83764 type:complete len:172 (+) Transcript_28989:85-600(+)
MHTRRCDVCTVALTALDGWMARRQKHTHAQAHANRPATETVIDRLTCTSTDITSCMYVHKGLQSHTLPHTRTIYVCTHACRWVTTTQARQPDRRTLSRLEPQPQDQNEANKTNREIHPSIHPPSQPAIHPASRPADVEYLIPLNAAGALRAGCHPIERHTSIHVCLCINLS